MFGCNVATLSRLPDSGRSERVAVVLGHVPQRRRHRHRPAQPPHHRRDLSKVSLSKTDSQTNNRRPGTASTMSPGPSTPQRNVEPKRRTPLLIS
ncbi:hypothetical protein AWC25_18945 [Mycobacterium sherrisii]|uniref:Uncharacterized protein n=1 Tax=Mycobacterium sherrisii TaxID=243061 RepID=A0A1E3SNA8_9MYCO|nr:hypothetical protein BHQ21_20880 [Mycobacterium sherrisii]ORW72539.1 hypothetical protein AWC25_18945 [Mycobacterium sherrisii]